jgi:hypothetical protein
MSQQHFIGGYKKVITIIKPEMPLTWHRQLVAGKLDYSRHRNFKQLQPQEH